MTRAIFERELAEIQQEALLMATLVDSAIDKSIQALTERNVDLAHKVISDDLRINHKRYEIEGNCQNIVATQQPLASDLRTVFSVLHIIVDLERMGDHAEGIAKVALLLADEPPLKPYIDIPRMAAITREMLRASLESLKERDEAKALATIDRDDEVDALYDQLYRDLIRIMIDDPTTVERATHLTWVAHNLERIGDRVTNICERVVYLVTGKIEDLNVSKY